MFLKMALSKIFVMLSCVLILPHLNSSVDDDNFNPIVSFSTLQLPGGLFGPVSIAFDRSGSGPYTGISDGRILKYDQETSLFKEFSSGNLNRTRNDCDNAKFREVPVKCGRPLGLSFSLDTGNLYYTDAVYGLDVVNRAGGGAVQLATAANRRQFFLLSTVVSQVSTTDLYGTDYSRFFNIRNISKSVNSTDATGRLIKYDTVKGQATVVLEKLSGAAGVVVSEDGSFILVSELVARRIRRYWLKGPKANTSEIFKQLEGCPAEIKATEDGHFWVPVNIPIKQNTSTIPVGVKLDGSGKVVRKVDLNRQFPEMVVTVIQEFAGKLYVGSFAMPFIGVYRLA